MGCLGKTTMRSDEVDPRAMDATMPSMPRKGYRRQWEQPRSRQTVKIEVAALISKAVCGEA
jgi:hypothetical protein